MSEELKPYEPRWLDQIGAAIAGDDRDSIRQRLAERLIGTRGMGPTGDVSVGSLTPFNAAVGTANAAYDGRYGDAAVGAGLTALETAGMRGAGSALNGMKAPFAGSLEAARDASMAGALNNAPGVSAMTQDELRRLMSGMMAGTK